jgi:hypothetical protein
MAGLLWCDGLLAIWLACCGIWLACCGIWLACCGVMGCLQACACLSSSAHGEGMGGEAWAAVRAEREGSGHGSVMASHVAMSGSAAGKLRAAWGRGSLGPSWLLRRGVAQPRRPVPPAPAQRCRRPQPATQAVAARWRQWRRRRGRRRAVGLAGAAQASCRPPPRAAWPFRLPEGRAPPRTPQPTPRRCPRRRRGCRRSRPCRSSRSRLRRRQARGFLARVRPGQPGVTRPLGRALRRQRRRRLARRCRRTRWRRCVSSTTTCCTSVRASLPSVTL